ncbi:PLP-dependent aminotransferase family protein [candidate division KSB1 bacterium]|nr:PLP-dependent aminotransferase family protein [candidate division KSB1 bacterium]
MEPLTELFAERILNVQKSFIREILKIAGDPEIISFAGGLPNPHIFPVQEIRTACNEILKADGPNVLQYSTTEGYLPLREYIANDYNNKYKLNINADEILITNGSQQGLDLISKVLIEKGDPVIIERPGYLGALQALSIYQPDFHNVTLKEDGIDLIELTNILSAFKVKLFYGVPNFQNPSGISYSQQNRVKLSEILQLYKTIFVEDNPYGDLRFMGKDLPPLKKWLGKQSVMLGSFSKTVVPSFRLGWICADRDIMDKVIIAKQGADLHTNYFCQRIVHYYLTHFDINAHIEKAKKAYKEQRDAMVTMIEKYFPKEVKYTKPEGGMFLWVTLPEGMSSMRLFELAIKNKVAFVPGAPFYIKDGGSNTLRLNYSNSDPEQIETGIIELSKAIKELKVNYCP